MLVVDVLLPLMPHAAALQPCRYYFTLLMIIATSCVTRHAKMPPCLLPLAMLLLLRHAMLLILPFRFIFCHVAAERRAMFAAP